jgi:hypothetical protein
VLCTAMLSTQADRNNGPPDGTQPEFDFIVVCFAANRAAYCIGQALQPLQPKLRRGLKRYFIILVHGRQASRKFVCDFQNHGKQKLCRLRSDSTWQIACQHFGCLRCDEKRDLLNVAVQPPPFLIYSIGKSIDFDFSSGPLFSPKQYSRVPQCVRCDT